MPSLWSSLADLRVRIDDYSVERRELAVSSSFTRVTTTVVLCGDGQTGEGEDVTYTPGDHEDFPHGEMLAGTWSLHDYSVRLNELELFAGEEVARQAQQCTLAIVMRLRVVTWNLMHGRAEPPAGRAQGALLTSPLNNRGFPHSRAVPTIA